MKSTIEHVIRRVRTAAKRLLEPFRGSAPGAVTVEYLLLVGFCAFLSIAAFHNYGRTLNEHLDQQAEHIHGRGMPNAGDLLDVGDPGGDSWCPPGLWFCVPMPDLPDIPDLPDGTSGGSTPDPGEDDPGGEDDPSDGGDDPGDTDDDDPGDDPAEDDPGEDDPTNDDPGDDTGGGDDPSDDDDDPSEDDPSEDPEDDETEERETDK